MIDNKDEIAILAAQCVKLGSAKCTEAIEFNIAAAVASGRWDEMNKWHRVRLRARRIAQEQMLTRNLSELACARAIASPVFRPL